MKFIKNSITVLMLVAAVQALGQNVEGMQRLPNGLQYKIFTSNTGPKIKLNDIVTFNYIQKTDRDSVLTNSFITNQPHTLQVQAAQNVADLMDFFPLLSLNDSALVKIPTDSVFNKPGMQRPPMFPPGSSLFITVKVNRIQSLEEAMAEQKKVMDKLKAEESAALTKYITDNKLSPQKTSSGLMYLIWKPSAKTKLLKGDTVLVNYTGKTLGGKVFDSSVEAEATKAGLQQPGRTYEPISVVLGEGRVIRGWEEGLLLLNEGSKATFIIPSELAYGPQAMGEDIQPFTPLLFDLEVVKVKRPKAKSATPAKPSASKPAGKKPAAKKPAPKSTTAKKPTTTKKK